ncbi:MAG TPA: MBL fold metallo-hydrolase [Rhizomicrobium sp.]|jgi:glyoxylase-like metal-dependent hydrolase (beta-lactamase superfamily II)
MRTPLLTIAAGLISVPTLASPYSDINAAATASAVTVQSLRGNISMLQGSGGNIGVLAGPDGLLMVDAGIAVSQKKIVDALHGINPGKIRYVINTHWHWDHTDGNGWVRRSGATIIANDNIIRRLKQTIRVVEWEHTFTPVANADLPNQTLSADKTMSFDGETIKIRHYRPSHTDGDMSVYFVKADILQTGDTSWNGIFPFIDYAAGGSIDGAITAANANIEMAKDKTIVIPGHGPIGNRAQLTEFRDMLVTIRTKVAALKAAGKTLDQIIAAKPTATYDTKWGTSVINGALFASLVYRGV